MARPRKQEATAPQSSGPDELLRRVEAAEAEVLRLRQEVDRMQRQLHSLLTGDAVVE